MKHTVRFLFLSLTLASPTLYAEGEGIESGSTAVATHADSQVSQQHHGHSGPVVPHSGHSGAVVPYGTHHKVEVKQSKKGTVKGKKSRLYGRKHRHMIKAYQEHWNKGLANLNQYLGTIKSEKNRKAILDHAQKHHGPDAPITQAIKQYYDSNPPTKK
ncbi:hypothetical protein [Candidatus Hepatobacter penaei]|uniref:hypothetical protein n=1 Tax=Candidatus Hepatobacter penaei TaxID=1274402 RepID=UPI0004F3B036|nr:hypothetical protein [Candidatus Hepatobacter penaei]